MKSTFAKVKPKLIRKKLVARQNIQKIFVKKYGNPVLVHSLPSLNIFKKIMNEGQLRVPKLNNKIKHYYIERKLGIYPCVFLSLGFSYITSYGFRFGFIFDLSILKKAKYYNCSLAYKCYRNIARYWALHTPEVLDKLARKNNVCKEVVDQFYNQSYNGKKQQIFAYWRIEKEVYDLIKIDKNKDELMKIIRSYALDAFLNRSKAVKHARNNYLEDLAPEVILKKNVDLTKEKSFLGFYISEKIPDQIRKVLIEKYPDKIVFDGEKIREIGVLR